MKPFNQTKIVACVAMHDDDNYADLILDDLEKYTNEIYVNLNDPTERVEEAVLNRHKKGGSVKKVVYTINDGNTWSQGLVRDDTVRLLDDVKPDIVLFPDSDEKYPLNMKEQLQDFWEDEEKKTFWFRLLYLWNDELHFRNDKIWKKIHHVRAFKWQSGITFLPKYAGYACPTTYASYSRETKYNSTAPTMHYGYMTEEDRKRKFWRAEQDYTEGTNYQKKMDDGQLILEVPKELL